MAELDYPEFDLYRIKKSASDESLSAQEFADQRVSELSQQGIVDIKVLNTAKYRLAGKEHWLAELRYPYKDKVLLAAIVIVPGAADESFVLVYRTELVILSISHFAIRFLILSRWEIWRLLFLSLSLLNQS